MANLYEAIVSHVKRLEANLYTTLPAKVEKVYEIEGATVLDVTPLINKVDNQGFTSEEGILSEIPIVWPSGGGFRFITPITKGDNVLLHFSMKSISGWKNSDGSSPVTPSEARKHDINDAFAVPCIYPTKKGFTAPTDALSIGSDDVEIRITKDGVIELGKGATEAILKGDAFKSYLDAELAKIKTHTHTVSGTSASASPELVTLLSVPDTTLSEISKTL